MIQYGSTEVHELRFAAMRASLELRDQQWIDVEVQFDLDESHGSALPEEIEQLTALLICTYGGDIAQMIPQDEGRDCEYQFTESEKEQLREYYEHAIKKQLLLKAQQVQQKQKED